ncbi:MAG: glucose 1-dehydrogenase [Dehalococcoidia bacterium]|nr:glucose 1-dehydrogenase [Dehalococcoidia bacterium]
MPGRVQGKVALITGSARGLGAACATVLAREGAKVVVTDILDDDGERRAALIRECGGDAIYVHLNVLVRTEWQHAVERAVQTYGRLDVLVNNVGGGGAALAGAASGAAGVPLSALGNIEQATKESWERVQDVNATSTFLGTQAVVPLMRRQASGCIINISSVYGIVGSQGAAAYHAAKGAVRLFTKATAMQLAKDGIRVNSIHPGHTKSYGLVSRTWMDDQRREELLPKYPLGRLGEPEDIGYGALFLASDASSFITGVELVIDGGYTAQ